MTTDLPEMTFAATTITTAFLTLFGGFIAIMTIKNRRKTVTPWGPGDDKFLKAHVLAHSNFSSYTPLFVLLLALVEYEWQNWQTLWLGIGISFVLGRIFHYVGMTVMETRRPPSFLWRQTGMGITLLSLFGLSIFALITACQRLL